MQHIIPLHVMRAAAFCTDFWRSPHFSVIHVAVSVDAVEVRATNGNTMLHASIFHEKKLDRTQTFEVQIDAAVVADMPKNDRKVWEPAFVLERTNPDGETEPVTRLLFEHAHDFYTESAAEVRDWRSKFDFPIEAARNHAEPSQDVDNGLCRIDLDWHRAINATRICACAVGHIRECQSPLERTDHDADAVPVRVRIGESNTDPISFSARKHNIDAVVLLMPLKPDTVDEELRNL